MKNHYKTLGIPESATPEVIKAAFKKKAVLYHPDKHDGNAQMEDLFKEVNEAYQILSNPYKKANFDLQLQHLRFVASRESADRSQRTTYKPPPHYRPRPYHPQRPISRKENNKATLYAFGITVCIAVMVMIIRGFYQLYLQKKYEAFLEQRRDQFATAQQYFQENQVQESLTMLANLSPFKTEEADMLVYQNEVLEDVIFMGEANFDKKDFAEAIRYYELVEQFSPYKPNALRARLALSYRYTHQPERSILMFKELITVNYEVVSTLVQMSDVYRHELKKSEEALNYLELARDVAVEQYRGQFGKAYMLVINHEFVPRDHFDLFENLASIYNELEQPEMSIGISNWMKRVWPDSTQSFVLAGKSYELLDKRSSACKEYNKAKALGLSDPLPLICL